MQYNSPYLPTRIRVEGSVFLRNQLNGLRMGPFYYGYPEIETIANSEIAGSVADVGLFLDNNFRALQFNVGVISNVTLQDNRLGAMTTLFSATVGMRIARMSQLKVRRNGGDQNAGLLLMAHVDLLTNSEFSGNEGRLEFADVDAFTSNSVSDNKAFHTMLSLKCQNTTHSCLYQKNNISGTLATPGTSLIRSDRRCYNDNK